MASPLQNYINSVRQLFHAMQFDEAIALSQSMIASAGDHNDSDLVAQAHFELYNIFYTLNQYPAAVHHIEHAIMFAREAGNDTILANVYSAYAAYALRVKEDLTEAQQRIMVALKITQEADNPCAEARARTVYAGVLHRQGAHRRVLPEYERALTLAEQGDDCDVLALILNNIGDYCVAVGKIAKAREYFERALSIVDETDDIHSRLVIQLHLAHIYIERPNSQSFNRGVQFADDLLNTTHQMGLQALYIPALQLKARIAVLNRDYDEARMYYQESIELAQQNHQPHFIRTGLFALGKLYMRTKNYPEAADIYAHIIKISRPYSNDLVVGHVEYAHAMMNMHQSALAFDHYRAAWRQVPMIYLNVKFYILRHLTLRYSQMLLGRTFGRVLRKA